MTVLTAGAEFQVNTYTQDAQWDSFVAALSDGGFVITWMSYGQDGPWPNDALYGIYAQRYDATGTPVGQEFRVNTTTNSSQERPAVVGLANGGFVITWEGASPPQQSNSGEIYAQLYDFSGSPVGSEFLVNSYSRDSQQQSSVAGLTAGGFVVTWTSQQGESGNDVFGKIYSSDGVPVTGDIRLTTSLAGNQDVSSVVGLADGGFVVARASNVSGYDDIYAQRYDSNGVAVGSEFQVNSYTEQNQTNPSVASLTGGGFAVTWQSYDQDGDRPGVYARIYAANGAPVGSEFQVNTYTTNHQHEPSITGLTNGGFLVTWASYGQDGADYGVYGQLYDSDGVPQGTEFLINTINGDSGNDAIIATAGDGNDVYRGGNGTDTVDYSAITASVRILLSTSATSSQTGVDTLSSIGNAVGGSANDVITGSGSMNVLAGGDGNDTINGAGGSDLIEGGLGSDSLTGGSGTDVLSLSRASAMT